MLAVLGIVGGLMVGFAAGWKAARRASLGKWSPDDVRDVIGCKTAAQRPIASVEAGAYSLVPTTITLGAGWDDETPSQRARRFTDAVVAASKKGPR